MNFLASWQSWALLSALFAALTAIFAKVGVENVNSDFATFVRTIVILLAAAAMATVTGSWQAPGTVSSRSWRSSCCLGEKLSAVNWLGVALIGLGAVLVALQV